MLTEDALQTCDGPALTQAAYELGLAPEGASPCPLDGRVHLGQAYWEPHMRLDQADVVFRGLRARGWETNVFGDARLGYVLAQRPPASEACITHEVWFGEEHDQTEAQALLLCAVIAVTSERCEPGPVLSTQPCVECGAPVPPAPAYQRLRLCTMCMCFGLLASCAACGENYPEHHPGGRGCAAWREQDQEQAHV